MMNVKSTFAVKDVFYTIQGEGAQAGRPAVFCRFAGCNGWSGLERDRSKGPFPCSKWCDTDFVGGTKMYEDALVERILSLFPERGYRFIVFTGGEPALQLTESLLQTLRKEVALIAIETNGSLPLPAAAFDCWITVSPKTPRIVQDRCFELKLIYPTIPPETFAYIQTPFRYLQPLHNSDWQKNTDATVAYVKAHPEWRLGVQQHKYIGIQ